MTNPDSGTLARAQREAGDLDAAEKTLRDAIAAERDDDQLADLYGMLGGTLRARRDLVGAAAAYDRGFQLEADRPSSYNELNRLVTRIELEPGCLSDPHTLDRHPIERVDVRAELGKTQARLQRAVQGERDGDYWAAGDLAVVAALNGNVALYAHALERFAACSPPASAYAKYHETFAALAPLDTPSASLLIEAKEWFEMGADGRDMRGEPLRPPPRHA